MQWLNSQEPELRQAWAVQNAAAFGLAVFRHETIARAKERAVIASNLLRGNNSDLQSMLIGAGFAQLSTLGYAAEKRTAILVKAGLHLTLEDLPCSVVRSPVICST